MERVAAPFTIRQRFTAYMRAYCLYTKAIDFLVFCGLF